jgi:hypothetical protein
MFEIVLLTLVTGRIAAFARGSGGKPWLWGTRRVAGYFLVPFLVTLVAVVFGADLQGVKENAQLWFFVPAVACVAVLAFCARFLLGRGYAKLDGLWSCSHCKYLNQRYAVICEAGKHPNVSKALPCS